MQKQKKTERQGILLKAFMKAMYPSGYHHNLPIKTGALDAQGTRSSCKFNLITSCVCINPQIFVKA